MTENVAQPNPTVLKKFPGNEKKSTIYIVVLSVFVILAGIVTGWFISGQSSGGSSSSSKSASGVEMSNKEAGIEDASVFKDSAEGVIEKGGIKGEGTHHLVRGEDESQYVYLTSTVIDLESFKGKKVTVWGETLAATTAGWLMDVGKVKVSE